MVVNAKIGNYITIARKDKASDDWYVGSATDVDARDLSIDLSFWIRIENIWLKSMLMDLGQTFVPTLTH